MDKLKMYVVYAGYCAEDTTIIDVFKDKEDAISCAKEYKEINKCTDVYVVPKYLIS